MKRTLMMLMVLAVGLLGLMVQSASAAKSTCQMSVTVTTSVGVDVTGDPLAFGSVAAGVGTAVTGAGASVTNIGTTSQSYRLQVTDKPAQWSVLETAGATGSEQIKLLALFTTTNPPALGDFTDAGAEDIVLLSGTKNAGASIFAINTEGAAAQGLNCTATSVRKLWFKFFAPASTTLTGAQLLTVTVTAY